MFAGDENIWNGSLACFVQQKLSDLIAIISHIEFPYIMLDLQLRKELFDCGTIGAIRSGKNHNVVVSNGGTGRIDSGSGGNPSGTSNADLWQRDGGEAVECGR